MNLGDQLVKEQLFFRKELKERVAWFIQLRWVAVAAAFLGTWAAFYLKPELPVFSLTVIIFFILFYNTIFYFIWLRLKHHKSYEVRAYAIFAHTQISLDLICLYLIIFFTGGIYSPVLIFVIFHIILAGILLAPTSCFIYAILVIFASGSLIILQRAAILPGQPILFQGPLFSYSLELPDTFVLYLIFTAVILISAFLITSIKFSLRTKGRELLRVSLELNTSNAKLTALYEMVKDMGACSDFQKLLDLATRYATKIMGVKGCSIKLLDDHRKILQFSSTYGLSEDYTAKGAIDIEKSLINKNVIQGASYCIGNISEEDYFQFPENIRKEGIASMVCLPLRVEKIILGVFCVYSETPDHFKDEDIKFFTLMTDLTAFAIENLKNDLSKTWFLKKAAHQLRSPINAISSMMKTMRKEYLGPVTQEQKDILIRCEKRIQLLGNLINDLLELEIRRTDIGKTVIHPVSGTIILQSLSNLYQTQALEKGIGITFTLEENLPEIMADERLIDELFANLISNAIKYTPPGGKIQISLAKKDQHRVRFEVSDTGIGIHEEDIPHLFSEFFRTENAKALVEEGTGLGLVVVKEILDCIKGTISVKSAPGKGTCFTCLLPSV